MMERCCGKTQTWIRRAREVEFQHRAAPHPTSGPMNDTTGPPPPPIPRLPQVHNKRSTGWEETNSDFYGSGGSSRQTRTSQSAIPFPYHANSSHGSISDISTCSEDASKYPPPTGGWTNDAYAHTLLDPYWTNFTQQLGF